MLKRLRFPALALATALAVAAPTLSLAGDRDDHRGRDVGRHEYYRGDEHREFRRGDRDDFRFGVGVSVAPVPAPPASGYYDAYGVWHPYGYYDQFGVWHQY